MTLSPVRSQSGGAHCQAQQCGVENGSGARYPTLAGPVPNRRSGPTGGPDKHLPRDCDEKGELRYELFWLTPWLTLYDVTHHQILQGWNDRQLKKGTSLKKRGDSFRVQYMSSDFQKDNWPED